LGSVAKTPRHPPSNSSPIHEANNAPHSIPVLLSYQIDQAGRLTYHQTLHLQGNVLALTTIPSATPTAPPSQPAIIVSIDTVHAPFSTRRLRTEVENPPPLLQAFQLSEANPATDENGTTDPATPKWSPHTALTTSLHTIQTRLAAQNLLPTVPESHTARTAGEAAAADPTQTANPDKMKTKNANKRNRGDRADSVVAVAAGSGGSVSGSGLAETLYALENLRKRRGWTEPDAEPEADPEAES
jgi:hypothetical protein